MENRRTIPNSILELPNVIVVCGHYGAGKTTFSLNLALDLAAQGRTVTLVDLDVVNPYFRSSEHGNLLSEAGITLVSPHFAGTALDAPMLSGRIGTEVAQAYAKEDRTVVVDVGGDDAGATALGAFSGEIAAGSYAMLYVVNALREQTLNPEQACALLPNIEAQSKCRATGIVNNTHLMQQTIEAHLCAGQEFAETVSERLGLPLICTTCPESASQTIDLHALECDSLYIVRELVVTPWDA